MFLVAKLNCWPFYFRDLPCKDRTPVFCRQGNWVNDEQREETCPKLPLEPGVYQAAAEGETETGDCSWDLQYVLVKPSGQIYVFLIQNGHFKSLGTSIHDLFSDISLYRPQTWEMPLGVKGSEIAKILPEFRRLAQPRPFSICLVGEYGGQPLAGGEYFNPHAKVLPDGSVHYTPSYHITYGSEKDFLFPGYRASVDARGGPEEPTVLQVESVSRPDEWTVNLQPGQVPRLEVVYPPLCVLKMTNGQTVDLSRLGFHNRSALLSSTRISYYGSIKETEGSDCIVSFPGKYADGWRECVQASSHDMGVACVFLCGKEDGFGKHAIDPDADGEACYCHKIYGRRKFDIFGHKSEEECKANGNRPTWGCLWFEKWRNNVETAVKRKQRLIVYFFGGEVGQGLVKWDDLATAELWDGRGIGGSQKGEVAFLEKMGYKFDMRDVEDFLESFAKESAMIP